MNRAACQIKNAMFTDGLGRLAKVQASRTPAITLIIQPEHQAMGLFKPDLYRSFFFGFGVTALLMSAKLLPSIGVM